MKIKRLEITGFKSFVDRVSLDFPQGITAVVGPNGCGKSNIVDAIRWVMGEQSARNLRGRQMEDIIFGGCETRKPLGMAEVSLVFSTEDNRVPAKYLNYSEIQVTRRLYRDGDSEYLLNKTSCRLLDIAELFMDTGVGARAYSIIEQGRIGMILLSKPEERRFLIEEAAGVTKYRTRKQVALKKIELSRQNLVRIGDIISELKRQLGSLQRQAKKAERFRAYREELKELEVGFAVASYNEISLQREAEAEDLAALHLRDEGFRVELAHAEVCLEEQRVVFVEAEKALTLAQEELFRCRSDIQSRESAVEFQKKEISNLHRNKERLSHELIRLRKELTEAKVEQEGLQQRRDHLEAELAGGEQSLVEDAHVLAELAAEERDVAARLDDTRKRLFGLLSEISHLSNQEAAAARRLESIDERFERNSRERLSFEAKLEDLGSRHAVLHEAHQSLIEQKRQLSEAVSAVTAKTLDLKAKLETAERELLTLRDELSKKRSRLHSLKELEAQFAGYGQGVRTLFLTERYRALFPGIVADFLDTDENTEVALEAALGEKLQYVVTAADGDALAAVAFLKEAGGGRCSFVQRSFLPDSTLEPLDCELLLGRVTVPEGYENLVGALLANTYLVSDLGTALFLSHLNPGATFVTPDGDLASYGGIISGGASEGNNPGLVHKKREIKELDREVHTLSAQLVESEDVRGQVKRAILAAEDELRLLRQNAHDTDLKIVNCHKDLQRVSEERRGMEERLGIKDLEDGQLHEEREGLLKEMEASRLGKCAVEERKAGLEEDMARLQETVAVQKRQIDEHREALTAKKVKSAELKEKRESANAALARLARLTDDVQRRIDAHDAELLKSEEEELSLVSARSGEEEALERLQAVYAAADAAYRGCQLGYERSAAAVQEQEARLKDVRSRAEQTRGSVAEKTVVHAELTAKLQILENSVMDRYRLSISSLVPAATTTEEGDRRTRQSELQRLLDEIGEVNLSAVEEYQELEERFMFLSTQKTDLEESLHALQKAIQRINKTTRKRFIETFHQVNAKFQEVFPRLFCGGRAELRLTNEEDLLETGIDIVVQPPGKKLQNVSLLSGGEKALTAVALIFSIFLIKPSPFCLLDEVDAPLDDANIGRFNEIVREMTAFSQFIIITHNKATMAVADTLFGVTMDEPGVSKLVSVRLN